MNKRTVTDAIMRTGLVSIDEVRERAGLEPKVVATARHRFRQSLATASAATGPWYRISNEVGTGADGTPEILIYGEIGSDWFPEDVLAYTFVRDLAAVDAPAITVRINSPGGFVFDGIVIYNALKDHPAKVHVIVDGLAASAASFIAMAGDTITMNRASEMMIHDAWGLAIGNSADMLDMAQFLDRQSNKVAGIYAARAGGPVERWREAMTAETWYSPTEAVAAGLADEATDSDAATEKPAANLFTHASRAEAPDQPKMSTDAAPEATPDSSAAEAAERKAAARQRRHAVAQAEIRRIKAKHPSHREETV